MTAEEWAAALQNDPWAALNGLPPELQAELTSGMTYAPDGQALTVAATQDDPDQWVTLADGSQVKTSEMLPGETGRKSSRLVDGNTRTVDGDVFNPFRGYVGPDGGTFGDPSAPVDEDARLRTLLDNPGFSVLDTQGQEYLRKALGSGNADTRAVAARRVAANSGRQSAGDFGMGGNPNLLGYQFFDSLTPEQRQAAGVDAFALNYGRAHAQTQAAVGKGYTVANGRLINRAGSDVGALADAATLGPDAEFVRQRQEALHAHAARPVQSATGQGFGTGWQNPYANVRPLQQAAQPSTIGTPSLNAIATRPLSGGSY